MNALNGNGEYDCLETTSPASAIPRDASMTSHRRGRADGPGKNARRRWFAAIGCALIVSGIAVAAVVYGLGGSDERGESDGDKAQKRCETATLNRLISPSTAKPTKVQTAPSQLDTDSRDLFSLLDEPLKGVDHSRIASIPRVVTGVGRPWWPPV